MSESTPKCLGEFESGNPLCEGGRRGSARVEPCFVRKICWRVKVECIAKDATAEEWRKAAPSDLIDLVLRGVPIDPAAVVVLGRKPADAETRMLFHRTRTDALVSHFNTLLKDYLHGRRFVDGHGAVSILPAGTMYSVSHLDASNYKPYVTWFCASGAGRSPVVAKVWPLYLKERLNVDFPVTAETMLRVVGKQACEEKLDLTPWDDGSLKCRARAVGLEGAGVSALAIKKLARDGAIALPEYRDE